MNNALPKQVRDQIQAADDIIEQMEKGENPPTDETPPNDPASDSQAPAKEPEPDPDDLNQRVLNVEGMLAALATKETPLEEPKPSNTPAITEDERAQFGDDLIDLMERVAKQATAPEIKAQVGKLDRTVQQQGEKLAHSEQAVAESKRQDTLSALAAAVPNWEVQNNDPAFLEWLNENEPSAGVPRGRLLTEAFRTNDAPRVIWFFTSFPSENATETSQTTPELTPEPQAKLDELVAPGTPKTGSVVAPNESGKRVWTRNDITALYAEKNEFIKRGKKVPDELVKLERDLFKAQHEGRLR